VQGGTGKPDTTEAAEPAESDREPVESSGRNGHHAAPPMPAAPELSVSTEDFFRDANSRK
jgi:hypothetical protein